MWGPQLQALRATQPVPQVWVGWLDPCPLGYRGCLRRRFWRLHKMIGNQTEAYWNLKFSITSAYSCFFDCCFIWVCLFNTYAWCFEVWYWDRKLLSRSIREKMQPIRRAEAVNEWQRSYVLRLLGSSAGIWPSAMLPGPSQTPAQLATCGVGHCPLGGTAVRFPLQQSAGHD